MTKSRIFIRLLSFFNPSVVFHSACIIVGLLLGTAVSGAAGDAHNGAVLSMLASAMSISSLFCIVLFPALITMVIHKLFGMWGIIAISFLRSFFLSLISGILAAGFASAAWFYIPLVTFTGCITFVLLIWLWRRILRNGHPSSRDYFIYFAFAIPAWCIDYVLISPFLVSLLKL